MMAAPAIDDAAGCLELMLELYRKFWAGEYGSDLFDFGRGYLRNQYPFSIATPDARVSEHLHAELLGYHPSWVGSYLDRLSALKLDDIRDMPRRYLSDGDLIIVVVGTRSHLEKALASLTFKPEIEVVPFDREP
jgi:predicted Zn-dependent peptidase